jgi:UDP-N-acetylmuramoyl-tripeptide--D-alanyl-D-alanine ligase
MSRTQAGVTILDDSYNSNPAGAAEAFRVLSEFQGGQRVLVTPGLVELGALQEQENEKFGRLAARAADCVILVGPEQTRPVARGLKAEGFPPEHTHVVKSLSDATALLGRLLRPGDTVLFENDLPDLYTER